MDAASDSPVGSADVAALARIADELYVLHPTEFTAARNARAAELRASDRPLSDAVKTLPRAAPAAWVASLLVREQREDVDALLALGSELREAQQQLDRAALTRLGAERRRQVAALARAGAELAEEDGHPISTAVADAVAETLQAAMTDPEAGTALLTGRLIRSLESVGFDAVDLTDAVAASGAPGAAAMPTRRRTLHAVDDPDDDHLRQIVLAAEAAAQSAADEADAAVAIAETRASDLDARRRELAVELQDLEDEIVHTRRAISAADREVREVDRARDAAIRGAERAQAALEKARARRARLDRR